MKNTLQICILLFATLIYSNADAVILEVNPTDDRTIGSDGQLSNQTEGLLRTGFDLINWRSALEFNISDILSGSIVSEATLFLSDQGASNIGQINIWGYQGNGVIESDDRNRTFWVLPTLHITNVGQNSVVNFSIDITPFIVDLIDQSNLSTTFAGILLGTAGGASDLCSVDGNCNKPLLTVEFTPPPPPGETVIPDPGNTTTVVNIPEPASVALFLLGITCLAAVKRKNHLGLTD